MLLIGVLLVGCGGSPDALFASANPGGGDAAVVVDVLVQGGDGVSGVDSPTADGIVDVWAPSDVAAEVRPDADVDEPDATVADALPALDACPCYRNMAMDVHCTTELPEAWVCQSKCGLPGCTYDYAPQPGLACCPEPDAQ